MSTLIDLYDHPHIFYVKNNPHLLSLDTDWIIYIYIYIYIYIWGGEDCHGSNKGKVSILKGICPQMISNLVSGFSLFHKLVLYTCSRLYHNFLRCSIVKLTVLYNFFIVKVVLIGHVFFNSRISGCQWPIRVNCP